MEKSKLSKNERRTAAREKAQKMRQEQIKSERRSRWLIQGGVLLGIISIITVVTLVVVFSVRNGVAGPRNMASDGIIFTAKREPILTHALGTQAFPTAFYESAENGKINIRVYQDYACPHCKEFEDSNMEYIGQLLDAGNTTLAIHPIAILASGLNRYSIRAANAIACVADSQPKSALTLNRNLYDHQASALASRGLTDETLWTLAKTAGADTSEVEQCIKKEKFADWVQTATERATRYILPNSDRVSLRGTPTVLVNGQLYEGAPSDNAAFKRFVSEAQGKTFSKLSTDEPNLTDPAKPVEPAPADSAPADSSPADSSPADSSPATSTSS